MICHGVWLIITKLKGIDVPPHESTNPHKGTNSQLMPMVNQQINNVIGSRVTTVVGRAQFPVVNQQINNYVPTTGRQPTIICMNHDRDRRDPAGLPCFWHRPGGSYRPQRRAVVHAWWWMVLKISKHQQSQSDTTFWSAIKHFITIIGQWFGKYEPSYNHY